MLPPRKAEPSSPPHGGGATPPPRRTLTEVQARDAAERLHRSHTLNSHLRAAQTAALYGMRMDPGSRPPPMSPSARARGTAEVRRGSERAVKMLRALSDEQERGGSSPAEQETVQRQVLRRGVVLSSAGDGAGSARRPPASLSPPAIDLRSPEEQDAMVERLAEGRKQREAAVARLARMLQAQVASEATVR